MKKIKKVKESFHERDIKKDWFDGFSHRRFIWLSVLIILGFTVAVYANSLENEFTNWDDRTLIVRNQSIRSLGIENLRKIFTLQSGKTFQPIRVLSYAVDYHFWKLNPVGYHIHNILLHGMAAVLLFLALIQVLPQIKGMGHRAESREQGAEGREHRAKGKNKGSKIGDPSSGFKVQRSELKGTNSKQKEDEDQRIWCAEQGRQRTHCDEASQGRRGCLCTINSAGR